MGTRGPATSTGLSLTLTTEKCQVMREKKKRCKMGFHIIITFMYYYLGKVLFKTICQKIFVIDIWCVWVWENLSPSPVPFNPFSLLLCSHSASELPISINQRPVFRSRDHSRPIRGQGMLTVESHNGNVSLLPVVDRRADGNSLLTSLFIDGSAVYQFDGIFESKT